MIELRGVCKTVPSGAGSLTILHPLDLTIDAGRVVAITGPSGSGKSTLLGLLAGLDAPSSGSVILDGVDITALDEDSLARLRGTRIGFVFQFFHLLPSLTALENVLVPMEIAGVPQAAARAKSLLDEVGLQDRGHHYPSQLSGGEQQRVAIARALAKLGRPTARPCGVGDDADGPAADGAAQRQLEGAGAGRGLVRRLPINPEAAGLARHVADGGSATALPGPDGAGDRDDRSRL
jgi:putative ABC transport system ATP-binding protein